MLLALFLLQITPDPSADLVVTAPPPPSLQSPATMVVEPVAMMIATFDSDGDGRVDRSELTAGVARSFAASNPPGRGAMRYLTFADWAQRWLGDAKALPSPFEVDRNSDDQVSIEELQNHFARLFARYDRDNDKAITRAELLTFRTAPVGANGPTGGGRRPDRRRPSPNERR